MTTGRKVLLAGSIVFLGVAAAVVVMKSQGSRRVPASTIVMMSDLKNLALLQAHMKDSTGRYADRFDALEYHLAEGVTNPHLELTSDGYTITLGHEGSVSRCVIYAGATPIAPAIRPEAPACTVAR